MLLLIALCLNYGTVLFFEACLYQLDNLVSFFAKHQFVSPAVECSCKCGDQVKVTSDVFYRCGKSVVRNRQRDVECGWNISSERDKYLSNSKSENQQTVELCGLFSAAEFSSTPLIVSSLTSSILLSMGSVYRSSAKDQCEARWTWQDWRK